MKRSRGARAVWFVIRPMFSTPPPSPALSGTLSRAVGEWIVSEAGIALVFFVRPSWLFEICEAIDLPLRIENDLVKVNS